jgi:hypothetical protein
MAITTKPDQLRRTRVDLLIHNLSVPIRWDVGRVTFRPPGWLLKQLDQDLAEHDAFGKSARDELTEWKWSSASVSIKARRFDTADEEAISHATDAIAVARLYQRSLLPAWGLDNQTFGLMSVYDTKPERTWRSVGHKVVGVSARNTTVASWEFRKEWIRAFRSRPAFAFLDDALRMPDPPAGTWMQRAISCVRTLNLANPMQSEPIRLVLQAVALEALLGDDPPPSPRREFRAQAHPVAQRAAFLTCPVDGPRLSGSDTACLDLTAPSARAIERDSRFAGRPPDYWNLPCSAYWHIREIFGARNDTLHDARDQFPRHTAMRFESRVDDVILDTLDWVVTTRATGLSDLDDAIRALPQP